MVGSPCSPRDSQESSPTPSSKPSILQHSAFFIVQLSHPYLTTGKTIAFTRWIFVGKVMSLLFNMLSRLALPFLCSPGHYSVFCTAFQHAIWVGHNFPSKEQASFNFMAAVTICSDFGAPKNKVWHCFHCFLHLFPMKWWDRMPWSLFSECWALNQIFHSPLSLSSRGSLVLLHFLP